MTLKKPNDKTIQKIGWSALILLLVSTLVIMGYLIVKTQRDLSVVNQQQTNTLTTPTTAAEALLTAQGSLDPEVQSAIESGDVATLESTIGGEEFGVATRTFKDGTYSLDLFAFIANSPADAYYEAWLDGSQLVSLGRLSIDTTEADVYLLTFSTTEDLRNLNKVIISQRSSGEIPEKVIDLSILEGEF